MARTRATQALSDPFRSRTHSCINANINKIRKSAPATRSQNNKSTQPGPKATTPYNRLYNTAEPAELLECFDFGTSKIQITFAINDKNSTNPLRVHPIACPFQAGWPRMPALVGVKPLMDDPNHAELVFGTDVESNIKNQRIKPQHVFSNMKQMKSIMDPSDPAFKDSRDALLRTQQKHSEVLEYVQQFEHIRVRYPRGGSEVYYRDTEDDPSSKSINRVEDIFVILVRWAQDHAKLSFALLSVAVPDVLPSPNVTTYHGLMVTAGLGKQIEMLSEARCSAIKVAVDILGKGYTRASLGTFGQRDIDVCDMGHGTTEITTIRAKQNGVLLSFECVVDAVGCATGGKVVEDSMIEVLREQYTNYLGERIPQQMNGTRLDKDTFLSMFQLGCAEAKVGFANNETGIDIVYYGDGPLTDDESEVIDGISLSRRGATMSSDVLRACYNKFLDPIVPNAKRGKKPGLLQKHYSNLVKANAANEYREIFVVGGAAIPVYVQNRLRSALGRMTVTSKASVSWFGKQDEAYVSGGGVIMLADRGLRKRRFHNESLGSIIESLDKAHGSEVVWWFYKIGQQVHDEPEFEQTVDYIIPLESAAEVDIYPKFISWPFVRTSNKSIGQQNYPIAAQDGFVIEEGIQYAMDEDMCKFITYSTAEDGQIQLAFDMRLRVKLDGLVVRCEVGIPKGGRFNDPNVEVRSFSQFIKANITHVCHEGVWDEI